ncbi:putative acyl-CoA synthetase [Colletotrichum fructicola]|nr:putative acyl-CoA synthetase [Colletotrichum fructicola]KAE9575428.1 putative acyl-CoA synthetase [Colletotrichum fructicola]KAF4428481.1 Acyl-CoA ligase sidI [Colletotrichum fructicola]KAF4893118.1 Acyl-CoA ligase sidI [Colletotrichum fructicola]
MSATAVSSFSPNRPLQQTPSLVFGPKDPPLLEKTLGSVIQDQAKAYGDRTAVVVPWQSTRLTYNDLADRSKITAKGLLELGLKHGDCVGIMAGNCYQYTELFLGAARIGCPFVVLHNTYSPDELSSAVLHSDCKAVFMASQIGSNSLLPHIQALSALPKGSKLEHIVCLDTARFPGQGSMCQTYSTFLNGGHSIFMNDSALRRAERKVRRTDTLNLQFTSGTTGSPKAAVLTHFNLINDARFVGDAMQLTHEDVVCCPPPLFHCFGLVMGFLAAFCYGSSIIFPSDSFNAQRTIDAIINEKATALLGVPTMFIAELEALKKSGHRISTVRTGLAAGSPVPPPLMESLRKEMQIGGMLIAYGMTETSPVTFITALGDTDDRMFKSLGKVLPHTGAKIVDTNGNIVPRGTRGEICTSGFALQKGYWKDEERTQEVMRRDEDGVTWMHTGDEGFIDNEGYGHITGRIKDLIIRGGENISPIEIEARLLSHAAVGESCAVGLDHKKYGEVVACFLKLASDATRPSDEEIRTWVTQRLGRHKAPEYIFWLGSPDVGSELPKTGSGKYQKHLVRELGNALVKRSRVQAKL